MTTLTLDSILVAKAQFDALTLEKPGWSGTIRESPYITDSQKVKKNIYALVRKNKRLVYRRVAIKTVSIQVPSRNAFLLPDGSMVVHPTVAAEIRKAIPGIDKVSTGINEIFRYPYFFGVSAL